MKRALVVLLAVSLLAACDGPKRKAKAAPAAKPAAAASVRAVGRAAPLQTDVLLQREASVESVTPIDGTAAKIFTVASGEAPLNGLIAYIAVLIDATSGWRIYRLGEYSRVEVVSQTPDAVQLAVASEAINPDTGAGETVEERLVVTVPGPETAVVTVTPVMP